MCVCVRVLPSLWLAKLLCVPGSVRENFLLGAKVAEVLNLLMHCSREAFLQRGRAILFICSRAWTAVFDVLRLVVSLLFRTTDAAGVVVCVLLARWVKRLAPQPLTWSVSSASDVRVCFFYIPLGLLSFFRFVLLLSPFLFCWLLRLK